MKPRIGTFIYLPGAGGGIPDLNLLKEGPHDRSTFISIKYPGWRRYSAEGFTTEALIRELADEINIKAPPGPVRLIGLSAGGHFGYAIALRLEEIGREVGGFCAIDTFMYESAEPTPGWKKRAATEAMNLLRQRRYGEFYQFVQSRFWRAVMRLSEGRLSKVMGALPLSSPTGPKALDPMMETEMNMRLLLKVTTPWVATLDCNPKPLLAPSLFIRTGRTDNDDDAWRLRCPNIDIRKIVGTHHTLFDQPHVVGLREAFVEGTREWR